MWEEREGEKESGRRGEGERPDKTTLRKWWGGKEESGMLNLQVAGKWGGEGKVNQR